MTDFSFRIEPEFTIGADILNRAGIICKPYGTRALIATEQTADKEAVERLITILLDADVEAILFDAITPYATAEAANAMAELARGSRASMIIGFGGLKTQAIARLTAIIARSGLEIFELLDGKDPESVRIFSNKEDFLPYIAILGEIDPFVFARHFIAIDPRDRSVKLVKSPKGLCAALVLDGTCMRSAALKPVSTFDGISIALEAYCSRSANFFSDALLEQALSHYSRLSAAFDAETSVEDFMSAFLFTSMGVALSNPGIGTSLAYAIYGRFTVEKAQYAEVLLPHILEKLISVRPEKVAKAAALLGVATDGLSVAEAANAGLTAIRARLMECGLSSRLQEFGLILDRLIPIAEVARDLEFIAYSPWTVTAEEAFELVKRAF
ncbi:MAG: iron-containing alcohol dehydrogenase [Treponema sp.]|jgi:alcohol dehydrogenase|nr:iron-containing alcohol dehydrogenase [Treponema sp.]